MPISLPKSIVNTLETSALINGQPLDPHIATHTHQGKYSTVHYGIMLPNIAAPFNFLNLIAVVGQPKVRIFNNPHIVKTTPLDTANLLVGTAVANNQQFKGYTVSQDCNFSSHGRHLEFANDLTIDVDGSHITATRQGHDFNFELDLRMTDKIAHFVKLRGGLYDHWAILCQYTGHLEYMGERTNISGLCTYEYARGANIPLPIQFFTYQILNIDEQTQVLFVDTHGGGLHLQRRVYVRGVNDHGGIYEAGFKSVVHEYLAPVTSPNGIRMRLPKQISWQVDDHHGKLLIQIDATSNEDFQFGMAGGYAGSYEYIGQFKGQAIQGTGYIEYIDPMD